MTGGADGGGSGAYDCYSLFSSCPLHDANPLVWATDMMAKVQAG